MKLFFLLDIEEVVMTDVRKLAVLGGGVATITSLFDLTSQPDWKEKYDITLYQMGWRLGGKGASGRNLEDHGRIEEHGIHVWFGFYYNAFKCMRACYEELDRPKDKPLSTLYEAFTPHHSTALAQDFRHDWSVWPVNVPPLPGKVGEGADPVDILEALSVLINWLLKQAEKEPEPLDEDANFFDFISHVKDEVEDYFEDEIILVAVKKLKVVKNGLSECATQKDKNKFDKLINEIICIMEDVRETLTGLLSIPARLNLKINRIYTSLDFVLTMGIGVLKGELYVPGALSKINDQNFKDWLTLWGASELTTSGPLMNGMYGGFFAYKDGDLSQPNVEAGTVIKAGLWAIVAVRESFVWRMHAGMGDVVFAPYYEVLKRRGVKFKFFHQVEEICAIEKDGRHLISEIRIAQQVPLKQGVDEYCPLVDVKDLPCWPSAPLYKQIEPSIAAKLIENDINLESFWSNWSELYDQPKITLKMGEDYDQVIFGISVASIPSVAPSLMALNPVFKTMAEGLSTVATQAYQVWQNQDIESLGWPEYKEGEEAPEILGFDSQSLDSWADVSYLVKREEWQAGDPDSPKDISYFCGVFAPDTAPKAPDPSYPKSQKAKVEAGVKDFMLNRVGFLWPNANPQEGVYKWEYLVAPSQMKGEERLDAQYCRANIDPSERYVQSTVGTTKLRLKTDESGFDNLLITGDWILNGFNMGCVESATISGLQTARAVKGESYGIFGETLFD
ncbi:MAG: NAD(P)-binding protein [Marinomonas sp.]